MADISRANGAYKSTAVAVGTVAVALPTAQLRNRVAIQVYSGGTVPIYLGGSDVSATNGVVLGTGATSVLMPAGNAVLYAISAGGGTARVFEISEA